mgnify:CR=1 FL=1
MFSPAESWLPWSWWTLWARLVPEVLNNDESAETESFHNDLLEYPQYSRPENWHGKKVPEVLLSGNHKKISAWRREQSERRTEERRPDLYAKYQEKQRVIKKAFREETYFYSYDGDTVQRTGGSSLCGGEKLY